MQSQNQEYSYFLTSEEDLESMVDAYYSARSVDDHEEQEEDYSSGKEDDESDQEYETDLGIEFEFESDYDISERSSAGFCE